ncbi:hypothetical protein [Streptococcus sp. B01]|nr:hypothetical protein [Streptococcus sp. B01]MCQ9212869.1 hypothetical protein [Streptococcus sp. B01]
MKNIELIFSCIPMRDILNEFMKENNFQVIEFINELEAKLYTLSEFEIYQSEPIEICLPEPDMEFEYEYNKGCKFSELISIFRRNHG